MARRPLSKKPHLIFERSLWRQGYQHIAGLDEAGRGSWAGPVVAAAVVLPGGDRWLLRELKGVRDSKQLTPRAREVLYEKIRSLALALGVGIVPPLAIDALGIVAATQLAMIRALDSLGFLPHYLLIDALRLDYANLPQRSLIRGDSRCLSIASASIVAKVERDRLMVKLERSHPGYGFARNKGYGTPLHRRALIYLGPTKIHRMSFYPMKTMIAAKRGEIQVAE